MICIFCGEEKDGTVEHALPLSIGGTITTDRVCSDCNSILGARVDNELVDFFPVRMRRAKLGLAGNSGKTPAWYEMLLGEAEMVGEGGGRVRTTFNAETGKLETRRLYKDEFVQTDDGKKFHRVTLDARDIGQVPTIIERIRKRHNLPPLSPEELARTAQDYTAQTIDKPLIHRQLNIQFPDLRRAMFKIAFELAFLRLGDPYLDDPIVQDLRAAIKDGNPEAMGRLNGYVSEIEPSGLFNKFWLPHEDHHLAYGEIVPAMNKVIICVRIFDLLAGLLVVSNDALRYFQNASDYQKLRFLAIDASNGRTIDTAMSDEKARIAREMTRFRRIPPFPDPLASD